MTPVLRKATANDIPTILDLIKELATYEKAPAEVTITKEELLADGFGNNPLFEVILVEKDHEILGMAFYFISYSTWKGKCLFLEDIIVKYDHRKQGIGKLLFEEVINKAKQMKAKRLQWQVLDWNQPAIDFYKKYNPFIDNTWLNCKLTEAQLEEFRK